MKVCLKMSYQISFFHFPLKKAKKGEKGKKPKTSFSKARIKETREEFNESKYKFSKLKINEIRENLYKIEKEIDEDCYEPILVKSAFDGNCIQYESSGTMENIYQ